MITLNNFILEKLKINSKSKINSPDTYSITINNFFKFIENEDNNPFGKSLNKIKNNQIEIGKCYNEYKNAHDIIYLFPFYLTNDNSYCLCISLRYREYNKIDKKYHNKQDFCRLQYVLCDTYQNKLTIYKKISTKYIEDFGENINFEKYMDIIKDLYDISKNTKSDDFLNKYEQIIDERS